MYTSGMFGFHLANIESEHVVLINETQRILILLKYVCRTRHHTANVRWDNNFLANVYLISVCLARILSNCETGLIDCSDRF